MSFPKVQFFRIKLQFFHSNVVNDINALFIAVKMEHQTRFAMLAKIEQTIQTE